MLWTQESVDHLRSLLNSGLSGGQAAKEMGLTRNAVIGKAHRLGLALSSPTFEWTDDRIAELRSIAARGTDVAACARHLDVSRATIQNAAKQYNIFIMPAVVQRRTGKHGGIAFKLNHQRAPLLPLGLEPEPSPLPFLALSIADLKRGQCRYPHGDKRITFCGQEQMGDSSYCEFHHARTHMKRPKDRPQNGFVNFLRAAE